MLLRGGDERVGAKLTHPTELHQEIPFPLVRSLARARRLYQFNSCEPVTAAAAAAAAGRLREGASGEEGEREQFRRVRPRRPSSSVVVLSSSCPSVFPSFLPSRSLFRPSSRSFPPSLPPSSLPTAPLARALLSLAVVRGHGTKWRFRLSLSASDSQTVSEPALGQGKGQAGGRPAGRPLALVLGTARLCIAAFAFAKGTISRQRPPKQLIIVLSQPRVADCPRGRSVTRSCPFLFYFRLNAAFFNYRVEE